jgi:hypothetical protein
MHTAAYCTLHDNFGYYCTIFQTSNVDNCAFVPWVRILETAAAFLEVFSLRVDAHRPGTQRNIVVPLPRNFLATHRRLCRLSILAPDPVCPPSELDCLRILPCLSAHLCREDPNRTTVTTTTRSSSSGPRALSLSSVSIDGWTEFILSLVHVHTTNPDRRPRGLRFCKPGHVVYKTQVDCCGWEDSKHRVATTT